MLPTALSNHLCSLEPQVDRFCMVADMRVNRRGLLQGRRFYPAVMRSAARLTYNEAHAALFLGTRLREASSAISSSACCRWSKFTDCWPARVAGAVRWISTPLRPSLCSTAIASVRSNSGRAMMRTG